jgi:very-short-patch-repair endonuclease
MAPHLPADCRELLDHQHGIIARWQATPAGRRAWPIESYLRSGRWQVLSRGVYAAFTGPPSRTALLWAAVLRAGPGAILSHESAAELDKLVDEPAHAVHVTIASTRRVNVPADGTGRMPRLVVHHSARIDQARHPARTPPRTRIEETTVDLTQAAPCLGEATAWVTRACARRLTTTELLATAMMARPYLRWRTELAEALGEATAGLHSKLEARYVRHVEKPHGLPRAVRQAASKAGLRSRYLDDLYRDFGVCVELDGRAAHPAEARWRDIQRDNASAALGIVTLRYGWADITAEPCRVAAEIGQVLRQRGWEGRIRACGPACPVPGS